MDQQRMGSRSMVSFRLARLAGNPLAGTDKILPPPGETKREGGRIKTDPAVLNEPESIVSTSSLTSWSRRGIRRRGETGACRQKKV